MRLPRGFVVSIREDLTGSRWLTVRVRFWRPSIRVSVTKDLPVWLQLLLARRSVNQIAAAFASLAPAFSRASKAMQDLANAYDQFDELPTTQAIRQPHES